jgi:hypothetical protein
MQSSKRYSSDGRMAAEPTVRDALIAEMLGDIGKLHDAVQELKIILPHEMEMVEKQIIATIGLLSQAGDAYRQHVKTFTVDQLDKARRQLTTDAASMKREIEAGIRQSMADMPKTIHASVDASMGRHLHALIAEAKSNQWITVGLCFVSSVLGTLVTLAIFSVFR